MVLLGIAIRLAQWLGNPSLWFDELQLIQNLTELGLVELLTRALAYGQVAPVGFLLLTKIVVLLLGEGEFAFRVVPFAATVTALVLFWRLTRNLLGPTGAFVGTAAFALNPFLISLGSVVKPYATDVLATVLLLAALQRLWDPTVSTRSKVLVGAGAGVLGLLSIPSAIVTAAAIAALVYQARATGSLRSRSARVTALAPVFLWGVLAGAAALWARALLDAEMQEFMTAFWNSRGAFAPPFSEYPTWVFDRWRGSLLPGFFFRSYYGDPGGIETWVSPFMVPATFLGALLVSSVALARARGLAWTIAVLLPVFLALFLSRFEVYPLRPRTSAFLLPLVVILCAATTDLLSRVLARSRPWPRAAVAFLALLPLTMILLEHRPVYEVQPTRELLRELSNRRQPEEPVFAHPWSRSALAYYGSRFNLLEGVVVGEQGDVRQTLEGLGAFRGEPSVWVLFTLAEDRDLVICYLDEVGREMERLVLGGGMMNAVSIHRYDLSDETRWASADAAEFPVTDEAFEASPPRCRHPRWSASR